VVFLVSRTRLELATLEDIHPQKEITVATQLTEPVLAAAVAQVLSGVQALAEQVVTVALEPHRQ
jgi:hypothetical protein